MGQAQALAAADPDSLLHRFAARPEDITAETICQAMEAGDEKVQQMVQRTGQYLGIAAANIVGLLGVRRIVIAGSVARFGHLLLDAIREEIVRRSLAVLANEVELDLSGMGSENVIVGASALVLNRELGLFASPETAV